MGKRKGAKHAGAVISEQPNPQPPVANASPPRPAAASPTSSRCLSSSCSKAAEQEQARWDVAMSAMNKAFTDGKHAAAHFREEISALLVTDLPQLPNVRELILKNLSSLQTLRASLSQKVHHLPAAVRDQLSHLPDVQQFVHRQLEHVPEWRAYVLSKRPSFLENPHLPEVGPLLSELLSQCELPTRIVDGLHAIPSFSSALSSALSSSLHVDDMLHVVQHTLKDNMAAMEELRTLVTDHLHTLPDMQTLIHDQLLSWRPSLRAFHHLPDWMHDNHHIVTGYRPELRSFRRCFYSMFYIHNETGNIYSHALGALFFCLLSVYVFGFLPQDHPLVDRIVFTVFCMSAIVCLSCSAIFHCCFVHSNHVSLKLSKLDYSGITALIFGSCCAFVYFLLYCHGGLALGYNAGMAALGSLCAWASFTDSYRGPQFKWVRVVLFISFACGALVPIAHYALLYGTATTLLVADLYMVAWMGALYLLGALVYVTRFPECLLPGRFDFWFHSHQLWHCFVLAAAVAHYVAIYNMLLHRHEHSCAAESGLLTAWT
eukprot:m.225869 g.225869  ORF g.225869 m.225869 type:complete len:544 (-) comp16818_c0_seq1:32-1663(-)